MIFKLQRPLGGDLTYAFLTCSELNTESFIPMKGLIETLFKTHGNPPKLWITMSTHGRSIEQLVLSDVEIIDIHLTDPQIKIH